MKKKFAPLLTVLLIAAVLLVPSAALLAQAADSQTAVTSEGLDLDNKLYSYSLTLGDSLALNFYTLFSAEDYENCGLLVFPTDAPVNDYTYRAEYALTEGVQKGAYLVFTYDNIAAKEMADEFVVRTYRRSGNEYSYGDAMTVSVRGYASRLLSQWGVGTDEFSVALCNLTASMLNYGAEAQTYFGYNTDDLANSVLDPADRTYPTDRTYTDGLFTFGTATLKTATFYYVSLVLEEKPLFKIHVTAPSADGLYLEMARDLFFSSGVTSYPLSPVASGESDLFKAEVRGLNPGEYNTTFYFRITDGKNTSKVLGYSASTYAARVLAQDDGSLKPVLDSLFAYGDAATAYQTVSGTTGGTTTTPEVFLTQLRNGTLTPNATYVLSAPLVFDADDNGKSYNANNATVCVEGGVYLNGVTGMTLANLAVQTSSADALIIQSAENVVLQAITVQGTPNVAVRAEGAVSSLVLRGLTVEAGAATSLRLGAGTSDVYLLGSSLASAVYDASDNGLYAYNSKMGDVTVTAVGAELRTSTLASLTVQGAKNVLVADTAVGGRLLLSGADNVSVLKSTAAAIEAVNNKHLYLVSNKSSSLTLTTNNYMIADGNEAETTSYRGNQNQNGNNVTDVDARLEVGADESLLPHVDKNQFVEQARQATVRTENGTRVDFNTYITTTLAQKSEVFVTPGVYLSESMLCLWALQDKTVYAYGAMMERTADIGRLLDVASSENVSVLGLTMNYAHQANGQVYILKKLGSNQLLVSTGAGMVKEFGKSDPNYQTSYNIINGYRAGAKYSFCDASYSSITKNTDGTMTMTVPASIYNMFSVGDAITCRVTGGDRTVRVASCSETTFRDVTLFGVTNGFAFWDSYNLGATNFYRTAITTQPAPVIDEATYNEYRALETTYGISFGMTVDENGNYRGTAPLLSSLDATHSTSCRVGANVISCLFECMDDDGTNQSGYHGRLAALTDNGDGTTTITYKGQLSPYSYNQGNRTPNVIPGSFIKGDRVYIYTAAGRLVVDAPALSAAVEQADGYASEYGTYYPVYTVTVSTSAVDFDAIEGYDLNSNWYTDAGKVLVDNMSANSGAFHFDNTVIRNVRSRGLLLKGVGTVTAVEVEVPSVPAEKPTPGSVDNQLPRDEMDDLITPPPSYETVYIYTTVRNCTLENIGMGAIAVLCESEISWGESGVVQNLNIEKNLIRNTGMIGNECIYSPISIEGLGESTEDGYGLFDTIMVVGNKIENRHTDYALYVQATKNLTVRGNDFGARYGKTVANDTFAPVYLQAVQGVTLSDNTYPALLTDSPSRILLENSTGATGNDLVTAIGEHDIFSTYSNWPTYNAASQTEGLRYYGNWQVGYMPLSGVGFTPYSYYNDYAILNGTGAGDSNIWYSSGGVYIAGDKSGTFGLVADYAVTIAYTAPKTGVIDIDVQKLISLADADGRVLALQFAIFKNDTMIWPVAGGSSSSYFEAGDLWSTVAMGDSRDMLSEITTAFPTGVSVEQGDVIKFAMVRADSWPYTPAYMAYCVPSVYYRP